MIWMTPFCDVLADSFVEGMAQQYWVMQRSMNMSIKPALVRWWDNTDPGSAVLDVTNPSAVVWFQSRLREFKRNFGVDGFKLDAGETAYIPLPSDPDIIFFNISALGNGSSMLGYTKLYADIINNLTGYTEVRAAFDHQGTDEFVRVMDLDSTWGRDNGLGAMIPRVLLFSTLGYRYTLPDMIGGNGYGVGAYVTI
jgi:alpha-glucosidase (family GH31 glycosyl hydrolase)